ncbi:MAG: porin [bacterium]|nr:porin [bacterium]
MTKKILFIFMFVFIAGIGNFTFGSAPLPTGAELYQQKCSRCHSAYSPQKYSPAEWKTIVKEMGPLSGLTKESEKAIMDYLSESSAKNDNGLPTSPVLGGYLYTEYFSSKDSVDTFDIHYLNINLSGRIHERVTYRAEFELEHGGGESDPPFVEQAYLDVWFSRNMALRIGAMLTPFNRFDDFHGPLANYLVTRPKMSREIGNSAWKEVGINLHGNLFAGKSLYFNYDFYVINGLGSGSRLRKSRQYKDNNNAKSFGFRVSGVFNDSVEAGVSYYRGAWDDDGELALSLYGAHLLARFGNLNLAAEYATATSENPSALLATIGLPGDGKADGYFFQASYLVNKKFRPTIRYGTLDYLDKGSLLGRSATDYDSRVLAVGLNYYLSPSIVFKVEYDIVKEGKRKTGKDNNLLAFQAAVRF